MVQKTEGEPADPGSLENGH